MKHPQSFKSLFFISLVIVSATLTACNSGYKNDGKEVTWHTWDESRGHRSRHVAADANTFEGLDDGYGRDHAHAFYDGDMIDGADGLSFRVFGKWYAADNFHVYRCGEVVDGADTGSFKVHSFNLAEDKNDFYWNGSPLNVRDKSSFEILKFKSGETSKWGKDKYNGYYLDGSVIPDIDYPTFHPVEAYKRRMSLSGKYAADKNRVFFMREEVEGADPATFREVDFRVGQDKDRAYKESVPTQISDYTKLHRLGRLMYSDGTHVYDCNLNILPGADVKTFEHIDENWYKDDKHVWWNNRMLPGADPATFSPVEVSSYRWERRLSRGGDFNYGKDRNHVFFQDSLLPGADARSFEKVDFSDGGSWSVFDRYRVYSGKDSPALREYLKKKYGE